MTIVSIKTDSICKVCPRYVYRTLRFSGGVAVKVQKRENWDTPSDFTGGAVCIEMSSRDYDTITLADLNKLLYHMRIYAKYELTDPADYAVAEAEVTNDYIRIHYFKTGEIIELLKEKKEAA